MLNGLLCGLNGPCGLNRLVPEIKYCEVGVLLKFFLLGGWDALWVVMGMWVYLLLSFFFLSFSLFVQELCPLGTFSNINLLLLKEIKIKKGEGGWTAIKKIPSAHISNRVLEKSSTVK